MISTCVAWYLILMTAKPVPASCHDTMDECQHIADTLTASGTKAACLHASMQAHRERHKDHKPWQ